MALERQRVKGVGPRIKGEESDLYPLCWLRRAPTPKTRADSYTFCLFIYGVEAGDTGFCL